MRFSRLVVSLALVAPCVGWAQEAATVAGAVVAAKPGKAPRPLTDALSCSPFVWGAEGEGRPQAKMLVPVTVDGRPAIYELDTGADEVSVYGSQAHPEWKPLAQGVRLTNLQFAGTMLPSVVAYLQPAVPDTEVQGVLGLDPLVGKVLVIDFPRRRVCLVEPAEMPVNLVHAAQWNGAEVRHGKFFVRAEINGKRSNRLVYDTGASSEALVMDLEPWKRETGLADVKQATGHETVPLDGGAVEYATAPLTGEMTVANRVYLHPAVATGAGRERDYTEIFQADGVLGNALFRDSIVILDLTGHARFGLVYPAL